MAEAKAQDVGKLSFEDALAELEQIVRGLEGGQQKLEDAIKAYERGAALRTTPRLWRSAAKSMTACRGLVKILFKNKCL